MASIAYVSMRRMEDVSEIPWDSSVTAAIVPNLNEKALYLPRNGATVSSSAPVLRLL